MLELPLENSSVMGNPIGLVLTLVMFSLVPFLLLAVTSFVKLHVVFAVLKNAIGAGQIPSAALVTLLSLILTAQIMSPVASEVISVADVPLRTVLEKEKLSSVEDLTAIAAEFRPVLVPVENFLKRHSAMREREFFAELALRQNKSEHRAKEVVCTEPQSSSCSISGESLFTLSSAFIISELKEAFAIGFTIFLPFLVVDVIIAHLLVGLGMMMVNPVSISLPFKLLLFVMCDGWYLLCKGLIGGYL